MQSACCRSNGTIWYRSRPVFSE